MARDWPLANMGVVNNIIKLFMAAGSPNVMLDKNGIQTHSKVYCCLLPELPLCFSSSSSLFDRPNNTRLCFVRNLTTISTIALYYCT